MFQKLISFVLLVAVSQAVQSLNIRNFRNNTNQEFATETVQMEATSRANQIYRHVCELGIRRSDNVMCNQNYSYAWAAERNWEVSMRCPRSGSGKEVAYAKIEFWLTTNNFRCKVVDGCIGCDFIEIQVDAQQTKYFKYEASVHYKN